MEFILSLAILLYLLWQLCRCGGPRARLLIFFTFDNPIKIQAMAATLNNEQFVTGQIQPVTKKEKPAPVQAGTVSYASSDPSIFTVDVDPSDETKFTVTGVAPGTAQLDISADADLGDGVRTINAFAAIEVLPAEAAGFNIVFGEPQETA